MTKTSASLTTIRISSPLYSAAELNWLSGFPDSNNQYYNVNNGLLLVNPTRLFTLSIGGTKPLTMDVTVFCYRRIGINS